MPYRKRQSSPAGDTPSKPFPQDSRQDSSLDQDGVLILGRPQLSPAGIGYRVGTRYQRVALSIVACAQKVRL